MLYGAWLMTVLVHDPDRHAVQWAAFGVDSAFFVMSCALALTSKRRWPLVMASLALLIVATHLAYIGDRSVGAWAYLTAGQIWSYLALAVLAGGTFNRWRERSAAS